MVTLPACAQHAASHGGFSGHSGSVAHGGFAGSAPSRTSAPFRSSAPLRFSGSRGNQAYRSPAFARGFSRPSGSNRFRAPYDGGDHRRRPYRGHDRWGGYYGGPGYAFVTPYFLGYPDDFDAGDSSDATLSQNQPGNGPDDAESDQQAELPPYPNYAPPTYPYNYGSANGSPSSASPAPTSEQAVTLIFKDGRPPETIHNYLLTAKTLYVGDSHRRAIPTADLDLAATEKANQDAGIDFAIPGATR